MKNKTWKVPYLNLPSQYGSQKKELDSVFKRVMNEGSFILRKDVEIFEKNIASYLGVKYVIGVNSGTDALYLSLKLLNLQPKDEVITTALFPYAAFAVLNAGAKVILVDIRTDFNINPEKIEKAITNKTKAIIPVHFHGRASEMDKIMKIAKKYKLIVVEDACQALGSKYKGKKTGTFGLLGCFSTHPLKVLSCAGDGGFIVTNNNQLAKKLRILRNVGKEERIKYGGFGYNSRLDNLQAAILNVKFKNLDKYIKRRREIGMEYNKGLSDLPIILPSSSKGDTYNSYVIIYKNQKKLLKYLRKKKIEAFVHYPVPIYEMKELSPTTNFKLPMTERICKEGISLPINPFLTNKQVKYVIKTIKEYFK